MKMTDSPNSPYLPVPLIPLFLVVAVAIVKSYLIPRHLGVEDSLMSSLHILRNDLPFLGMIAFLLLSRCSLRLRSVAVLCEVVSALAITWYIADVTIIMNLNTRVPFNEVINYSREGENTKSELTAIVALFLLSLAAVLRLPFLRVRFSTSPLRLVFCFCLMLVPSVNSLRGILVYATPVFFEREHRNLIALPADDYSPEQLVQFGAANPLPKTFELPGLGKNIIFLVVESLSASDSFATSGLFNLVPRFDAISSKGTLFRNFFANASNSEMGMVAYLNEVPPLRYPGGAFTAYRSFASHPSVVERMKRSGYFTAYLSGATLNFLRRGNYYRQIGFDSIEGTGEAPEFQGHATHILTSVSDDLLYQAALIRAKRYAEARKPFFMTITTASSHLPYQHPVTGSKVEKGIWEYCDQQLEIFVNGLTESGFFEDGVLIITGDHRKMLPPNPAEVRRFGDAVSSRIALAIIGKGVPAGKIDDRWLDQSSLFRSLPTLFTSEGPLRDYILMSEPYISPILGENPAFISVFSPTNKGMVRTRLRTRGPELLWTSENIPQEFSSIEKEVHSLRARLQYERNTPAS